MEGYTEVFVWGSDISGQLGLGTDNRDKKYVSPVFCSFDILIKDISCGEDHSAFISDSGHIYCMGSNAQGKLGVGDRTKHYSSSPCLVESISHLIAVKVSCGWTHTAVVTNEGSLYTWGCGEFGVLGTGLSEDLYSPQRVFQNVQDVSCGARHMGVLSARSLYMCGAGEMGQLGTGRRQNECNLIKIAGEKVSQVSCGIFHTGFLTESAEVFTMGGNSFGQLGIGSKKSMALPVKVAIKDCIKVLCGNISLCIAGGGVFVWGTCSFGECLSPTKIRVSNLPVVDLAIGGSFVVAVDSGCNVYSWGSNNNGELGVGDYSPREMPTKVGGLKGKKIKKIAAGGSFVVCLGLSNREKREVPKSTPATRREFNTFGASPERNGNLDHTRDVERGPFRALRQNDTAEYYGLMKAQLAEAEQLISALQQENKLLKRELASKEADSGPKPQDTYDGILAGIKDTYLFEIKSLKKQLEEQNILQSQLEKDLNLALSHAAGLEQSLSAHKQLRSQSPSDISELTSKLSALINENSELKSLLHSTQSQYQTLQLSLDSYKQENSFLNQRLNGLSKDFQDSNAYTTDLENSLETLKSIIRENENSLAAMSQENSHLHQQVVEMQGTNKQIVKNFEKKFFQKAQEFKVKTLDILAGQRTEEKQAEDKSSRTSRKLMPEDKSPRTSRKELSDGQQIKIKNAVNKLLEGRESESPLAGLRVTSPSRKSPERPSLFKKVNEEFQGNTPNKRDLQGKINNLLQSRSRIEKKLHLLQKQENDY